MNINANRIHEISKDNVKLALILCYIVPVIIFYSMEVRSLYLHYGSESILSFYIFFCV